METEAAQMRLPPEGTRGQMPRSCRGWKPQVAPSDPEGWLLSLRLTWLGHHSGRCPGLGLDTGMHSYCCSAHQLASPPPQSSSAAPGTLGDVYHPLNLSFLVSKIILKTLTSQSCLLNKKKRYRKSSRTACGTQKAVCE